MTITPFAYYHPITVRYADLDPQGHVNNAVYLTYLESARLAYYEKAGIWSMDSHKTTGMVAAHVEIDYYAPIFMEDTLRVGVSVTHIGHKSLTFAFQIERKSDQAVLAKGQTIMVAYDNVGQKSTPIPTEWREKINQFENSKETK